MDMVATPCCCHSTSQLVASPRARSRVDPRNGCLDMVWLASLGGRRDKLRVLNGTPARWDATG